MHITAGDEKVDYTIFPLRPQVPPKFFTSEAQRLTVAGTRTDTHIYSLITDIAQELAQLGPK